MLTAVAAAAVLAVIAVLIAGNWQQTRRAETAASTTLTAFASLLSSATINTPPMLQLQIQWSGVPHVDTTLSGLTSTLFVSGNGTPVFPGRASFLTGTVTAADVCNTFNGLAAPGWSRKWSITPTAWQSLTRGSVQPIMGVAQTLGPDGRYASMFLQLLRENGFSAWSVMMRVRQVVVLPGTLEAACVRWHWTPLLPRPRDGLYVVRLNATPVAPWTLAVCDPGRYFSVMPGTTDSSQTITLQTAASGLSLFVNATTYDSKSDADDAALAAVLTDDNSVCVLGLAALAWFSAVCFDVGQQRLGVLTTRIGDVVQLAQTPVVLETR